MASVTLEKLWKKYGDVEAVRGISLDIADGEFMSFLGPSGCGKSSTMPVSYTHLTLPTKRIV